jgi:imidazolonepropionase-like amidohydrolase
MLLAGAATDTKAFTGVRLIDGTGTVPLLNAVLLVRDGRVVAAGPAAGVKVPKDAVRVELTGKTVMPGMINAHGHVGETVGLRAGPELNTRENVLRQLGLYARYGITTVFSLGGDAEAGFALRESADAPNPGRARLFVSGPVIVAATPEEARARVDAVAAQKPDFVKIRVDDNLGTTPKMAPPVYRAVIEQAHKRGLRVAAHLYYLEDAKGLLDAGVDFLAHSIRDREVDEEVVRRLKQRDVCLCPTLMREVSTFVYESAPAFFADPFFLRDADAAVLAELLDPKRQESVRNSRSAQAYKTALQVASRNLKKLADAGVRIAMGTDTGPPARFQGYFEHEELALMAKAGLNPQQVLDSATGVAARCLGVAGQLGTLVPGAHADFVVLGANPLDDIANTRTIESVWVGGQLVPRR